MRQPFLIIVVVFCSWLGIRQTHLPFYTQNPLYLAFSTCYFGMSFYRMSCWLCWYPHFYKIVGITDTSMPFYRNWPPKLVFQTCFLLFGGYWRLAKYYPYPFLAKRYRSSNWNIVMKSKSFKYSDNLRKIKMKKINLHFISK